MSDKWSCLVGISLLSHLVAANFCSAPPAVHPLCFILLWGRTDVLWSITITSIADMLQKIVLTISKTFQKHHLGIYMGSCRFRYASISWTCLQIFFLSLIFLHAFCLPPISHSCLYQQATHEDVSFSKWGRSVRASEGPEGTLSGVDRY